MDEITAEQIAQHYTAMGHSVDLIKDAYAAHLAAQAAELAPSEE